MLKIGPIPFRRSNGIVSFYFWCKEKGLEDTEQIVELLGSLVSIFCFLFFCSHLFAGHQHLLNAEEYTITISEKNKLIHRKLW